MTSSRNRRPRHRPSADSSIHKYMLIGPVLLFVAITVVVFVKRQAGKPSTPEAQLYHAVATERGLAGDPKATQADWQNCIKEYKRVFKKWPESKEVVAAYVHIGTIYKRRLKDRERAKEWYGRLMEEFPDSQAAEGLRREYMALALSFADNAEGREEALAAYTDYIERNAEFSELDEVLFKRGRLYVELKRPDEAIADFTRIMDDYPNSLRVDDAIFYTGLVNHALLKDADAALEHYERVLNNYPHGNRMHDARKRKEQIWEARVRRTLDGYFKGRYGIEKAAMFFLTPTPLYRSASSQDDERIEAARDQTLDLKSAELTVDINALNLLVTGTLVIANPAEPEEAAEEAEAAAEEGEGVNGDEDEGEEDEEDEPDDGEEAEPDDGEEAVEEEAEEKKPAPTEATVVWLQLNEGMQLQGLTQGDAKLQFERHNNLVKVTLAEPIAVDGETTLHFKVSNQGKDLPGIVVGDEYGHAFQGKDLPGIVIGEEYGHAFPHAFWFPITKLEDAFVSSARFEFPSPVVCFSVGRDVGYKAADTALVTQWIWKCDSPVSGRWFVFGPYGLNGASWGERRISLLSMEARRTQQESGFLDEAVRAADYLLGVFGTYPYDKIVFAQSPHVTETVFEHGAGLILINSSVPLETIKPEHICNELVQQWYGCLVYPGLDKWLWYTAGVAGYYETLYLKHRYDEATMDAHLAELADLYAEIFAHIGPRTMAFRNEERGESESIFNGLIYTKGPWAMRAFRWIAGDEHFVEAQRAFLKKFAFQPVSFRDLRESFEEQTGEELFDVFYEWLINPGTPTFKVENWTSTQAGENWTVSFALEEQTTKYVLPVEIAFESGEQRVVKVARITKTTTEDDEEVWHEDFTFTLPFDPERLVLDPNHRFLLNPKSQRVWTKPEEDSTTEGTEGTESSD